MFDRDLCTLVTAEGLRRECERVRLAATRVVWSFTDETVVHLDCTVEGTSPFADELRASLKQQSVAWSTFHAPWGGEDHVLDRSVVESIDAWLAFVAEPYERDCGMFILERPPSEYEWPERYPESAPICDPPPVMHLTSEQAGRVAAYQREGGVF